jgi:hypothetical protein
MPCRNDRAIMVTFGVTILVMLAEGSSCTAKHAEYRTSAAGSSGTGGGAQGDDGSCLDQCPVGHSCSEGANCKSRVCLGNVCRAATCADNVTNNNETDVDCGGACAPCGPGKQCGTSADCMGKVCDSSTGKCTPNCFDLVSNNGETGIDCGGSCPLCNGDPCTGSEQCKSAACGGGLCRLPTGASCGDEGAACATLRCFSGTCAACILNSDCQSNQCNDGVCKIKNGAPCGTNDDCANGSCIGNLCVEFNGLTCDDNAACASYHCSNTSTCRPCTGSPVIANMQCGERLGSGQCDEDGNCFLSRDAYCSMAKDRCLPGTTCQGFPPKCQ